jgi:hypothetical protein
MEKGPIDKEMVSALWVMQGTPECGGKLAAASRRERFRFCSCSASLCLPEELAKKWVIQLVPSSTRADQESFLKEAG